MAVSRKKEKYISFSFENFQYSHEKISDKNTRLKNTQATFELNSIAQQARWQATKETIQWAISRSVDMTQLNSGQNMPAHTGKEFEFLSCVLGKKSCVMGKKSCVKGVGRKML